MAGNNLKNRKLLGIISGGLAIGLLLTVFLLSPRVPVANDPDATQPEQQQVSLTELVQRVMSLKDDLKAILQDVKDSNWQGAGEKTDKISVSIKAIQRVVQSTRNLLGENFILKDQLDNIQNIADLADMGISKLLRPLITQVQAYPLEGLRVDDGINTKLIGSYLDFLETIVPDAQACIALAETTDLSLIDSEGKLNDYLELGKSFLDIYREYQDVLPLLRALLGADKDRLYLLAAQNSSEIRASGGFPGSMGTIRITDGVLKMGDFRSVYEVLATYTPESAQITGQENRLFHRGLEAPRDADYCPDFERVACIWSLGYEDAQKEPIDGVISMTPHIVQRLLGVMGAEIELFDGTVLNGKNATRVLQYDLYYKYFGREKIKNHEKIADELFADAAKQLMAMLTGNLEPSYLTGYLEVARESFADRTMMLWMRDETQQNMIRELGWHGGLNTDPEKPQAGVYYSCSIPSKLGWFLVMDTQIGERSLNEDGSYTYPVSVTFTNSLTPEEIYAASGYIIGAKGGTIVGSAYFFAPAGGTVGNFLASNGRTIPTEIYQELQVGSMLTFRIKPGHAVTVTYHVTTAPGVETPLTFSKTPTVQAYHE